MALGLSTPSLLILLAGRLSGDGPAFMCLGGVSSPHPTLALPQLTWIFHSNVASSFSLTLIFLAVLIFCIDFLSAVPLISALVFIFLLLAFNFFLSLVYFYLFICI